MIDHDARLVLTDALPPLRSARWLRLRRAPDASSCTEARAHAPGGASSRVVLDDRTLDGGGCDLAS